MSTSKRKKEHIEIALNHDIQFRNKTSGFEEYDFVHCALPEMAFDEVDTKTSFLGKMLSFPLMITAMTGGFSGAGEINRILSEVCEQEKIALGVGSQRQMIENTKHLETYRIVRKHSHKIPILGNIGASEIIRMKDFSQIQKLVDLIQADAMAVHLNPLQEILQQEGNRDFRGVLNAIQKLVKQLPVPVIVKEIGCGISQSVAKKLVEAGVKYIDVAGAGGTSWTGIEFHRKGNKKLAKAFWDWGISTAKSIEMVKQIKGAKIIASGGIRNGIDMAKAIALGAELCGAALPMLKAIGIKPKEGPLSRLIQEWREEFRMVLFLTGSRSVNALYRKGILIKNR